MKALCVRRVSRAKHLYRYMVGQFILRRLGTEARRKHLPRMAIIAHDQIGDSVVIDGRYETDVLDAVAGWLLPRAVSDHGAAVALDVGANIGNHTLAFAPLFAKVLAFEPNPIALHLLRANVEMNGLRNVEIYPFGLGRTDARLPYRAIQDNLGGGHFLIEGDASQQGQAFEVRNGDALLGGGADGRRIGLVKVDVEGMEASVFEGLSEVLRKHKPVVLFEALTPDACARSTNALRALGYAHFFAMERRNSYLPFAPLRIVLRLLRGADVLVRALEDVPDGERNMVIASTGAEWLE
jgi:FkbM family methyltransferase